jgi:NADP-dependent 3-hydroxy acid dehydrogenase YdfG
MNQNEVAVITGATSGIGLSIAEKLSDNGYKIIINGKNPKKVESVAKRLNCETVIGDIRDLKIAENILNKTISLFGRCDILINNAGIIEVGTIEEINIDRMCEMIRVNVEATFRLTYLFLKQFKQNNKGHLINITSVLGTKVRETTGAYSASKFAVEALSEALRLELANTNVKITCIEPGLVKTELHRNWEIHPSELMHIPDPLKPVDIANTVLWILKQKDRIRIPKMMILPKDHKI